jgi:hypothetical protein
VLVLIGGLGEETGWRGYLQPTLQRRFGPLAATGIVASVWAGWHLPQFFLIQTYQGFSIAMLPVFLLGMAGGAVVLTWLFNHTRSILACAVWHGLYNLAGASAAASAGSGVIAAAVVDLRRPRRGCSAGPGMARRPHRAPIGADAELTAGSSILHSVATAGMQRSGRPHTGCVRRVAAGFYVPRRSLTRWPSTVIVAASQTFVVQHTWPHPSPRR